MHHMMLKSISMRRPHVGQVNSDPWTIVSGSCAERLPDGGMLFHSPILRQSQSMPVIRRIAQQGDYLYGADRSGMRWAQRMVADSPTWSEEKWLRVEQILGVKFISSTSVAVIEACEVDSTVGPVE